MTQTLLLQRGEIKQATPRVFEFFQQVYDALPKYGKLLMIYAASPPSTRQSRFNGMTEKFFPENTKDITYELAQFNGFMDQLHKADGIYIHGGNTLQLMGWLGQFPDFVDAMRNKPVVSGSSAGAYVLSEWFYENNEEDIMRGLRAFPIKTITHANTVSKTIKQQMATGVAPDLPLYMIPEADYQVVIA